MKHVLIIFLCGMAFGCATTDTARMITRKCPIKYVEGDRASEVTRQGFKWTGGKVYVMDSCWWNSNAIASWAKANEIPCEVITSGNHQTLMANGKEIDYVYGIGLVRRRK